MKNDFFPKQVSGLIQLNAIRLIGGLLLFFFAEHLVRKNCVEIVPFRFSGDLCLSLIQDQFKDQVYKCKVQPDDQDNWI